MACIDTWTARPNAGVLEIILSDVESGKITYNPDSSRMSQQDVQRRGWYLVIETYWTPVMEFSKALSMKTNRAH